MRKLIVFALLLGVLLAALPVAATPTAALSLLGQYYPADTVIYAGFRTDDGYVETLDAVLARIQAAVPEMDMPARLPALLDMAAQQFDSEGDFESVFRSWLGDTAAFGLLSVERDEHGEQPFVFAASITNLGLAENFVNRFLMDTHTDFSYSTEGEFTIYEATNRNVAIAITSRALFLATNRDALMPLFTREARLTESDDFNSAIGRLPESDYDIAVYINTPAMMDAMAAMRQNGAPGAALAQMEAFMSAAASQAWGFTLIDGSSLVMDVASGIGDLSGLETAGFNIPTSFAPVDLGFAAHVPADALVVMLGSDLATTYNLVVDNIGAAAALQAEMGREDAGNFEDGMRFAQVFVRGLTGLDLQTEIMGWMTGSYALFMGINPDADLQTMDTLPIDFGLAIEATDPEAAANVVTGIQMAVEQSDADNVTMSDDQVAGVDVTVLTIDSDTQVFGSSGPIELVIGSNGEALAIGTRNAVEAIFQPVDGGLGADAAFVAAQDYFLSNTAAVFYLNTQPFEALAQRLAESEIHDAQESSGFLQMFATLIDSSSITGTFSPDGSAARFVLTLAG